MQRIKKFWWRIRFTVYMIYLLDKFERDMWETSGDCFEMYDSHSGVTKSPENAVVEEVAKWY